MITKAGIFAHTHDMIKILIPSDEITDNDFHSKYKKGDLINAEVIASRSTIYDNEIVVHGKLYNYKIIPKKFLLRKLSYPIYLSNTDPVKYISETGKIDFTKLHIDLKPNISDKIKLYEKLGCPIPNKLTFLKTVKHHKLSNPYGQVPSMLKKIKAISDDPAGYKALELLEILLTFQVSEHLKSEKINVILKNNLNKADSQYKLLLTNFFDKKMELFSSSANTTLTKSTVSIYLTPEKVSHYELIKTLAYVLKLRSTYTIIRLHDITDLFSLQFLCLIKNLYHNVWLYKPTISMGQCIDRYIIAHKFSAKTNIKSIFNNLNDLIKKIPKDKYADSFIKDMNLDNFSNEFITTLRNFNSQVYNLYIHNNIQSIITADMSSSRKNDMETVQTELSSMWVKKIKKKHNLM